MLCTTHLVHTAASRQRLAHRKDVACACQMRHRGYSRQLIQEHNQNTAQQGCKHGNTTAAPAHRQDVACTCELRHSMVEARDLGLGRQHREALASGRVRVIDPGGACGGCVWGGGGCE